MTATLKLLDSEQIQAFDVEYIDENFFKVVKATFNQIHHGLPFELLDIGGGNGIYADKVLANYPKAQVTLVEPDDYLLSRNRQSYRKILVKSTFQDYRGLANEFDYIQLNWVLHHFITQGYQNTEQLQLKGLKKAYQLLKPGGHIVIFENLYDGGVLDDLPSRLIYWLTANKSLTKLTKKMGANTAGVGVCFHSGKAWGKLLRKAGFRNITVRHCYDFGNLSLAKKKLLTIKKQHVAFITASKQLDYSDN
ncbi:class I SAM-dependent methyltransferase [Catenovulum sp. SM1970]|uniref:class I SAM-dependent methyltransferase n=1 Tax=Marinifaba aquimaris TaxID=2741323 RepID=UPI001572A6EB|nr:class I SAM-dependent methyltransferase [Marinifaba aquimaris]NTS76410.1 class I SAM-dependent methyltransferase [Marinifaba aquimaris]